MPTSFFSEKLLNEHSRKQLDKHKKIMQSRIRHIKKTDPEFKRMAAECEHISKKKGDNSYSTNITAPRDNRFVIRRSQKDNSTI